MNAQNSESDNLRDRDKHQQLLAQGLGEKFGHPPPYIITLHFGGMTDMAAVRVSVVLSINIGINANQNRD